MNEIFVAAISASAILLFYSFSLGLITLPIFNVSTIRMVPITAFDVVFMFVFSLLAGVAIARYWHSKSAKGNVREACTLSGGMLAGVATSICPFCPILLFTLLGASVTLGFLAPYFPFLRALSLALLFLTLHWLNKNRRLKSDKFKKR